MAVATSGASATGAVTTARGAGHDSKTVTNAEGVSETIGTSQLAIPAGTVGRTASGATAVAGSADGLEHLLQQRQRGIDDGLPGRLRRERGSACGQHRRC
jgi:hypothetical protein